MRSRSWMILGILMVLCMAASSYTVLNVGELNKVHVTIKTNGSYVDVEASSSIPFLSNVPLAMKDEIEENTSDSIMDPNFNENSTAESVKNDAKTIARKYNYTADVTIESQFGVDLLPMIAEVNGDSMYPTLKDGQTLVILKTNDIKVGDIVIAFHPDYDLIVKRVAIIEGDRVFLKSDNREVKIVVTPE
ncbi:MAG: S24 family peptidase, partial [Euryarchaeota archaeon]|nr:S24 family peptidase [Euryarchaeota archaeon]